jgi:hypothetical protein
LVLLLSFGYYEEVPEEVSMLLSFFAAVGFFAAVAEALLTRSIGSNEAMSDTERIKEDVPNDQSVNIVI